MLANGSWDLIRRLKGYCKSVATYAFAKLRKASISFAMSVLLPIGLSVRPPVHTEQLGAH